MIIPENATPEECKRIAEAYFPKRTKLEKALIRQELDAVLSVWRLTVTSHNGLPEDSSNGL